MENEEKKCVEAAPKPAKKFCDCGDVRAFVIALLTSLIVVAGYHMGRQAVRCIVRCSRPQQIQKSGGCGPCRCRMMRNFDRRPGFAPGGPGERRFGRPRFPGRPGMNKPGFPEKRGKFGRKPAPPARDAKVEQPAPAPAPAAPAAKSVAKPEAKK